MWKPKQKAGPAFKELSGHNKGETPEAQEDSYNTGCSAMNISAKHNPIPLKPNQKAMNTEAPLYEL